jgi:hypothetical protein
MEFGSIYLARELQPEKVGLVCGEKSDRQPKCAGEDEHVRAREMKVVGNKAEEEEPREAADGRGRCKARGRARSYWEGWMLRQRWRRGGVDDDGAESRMGSGDRWMNTLRMMRMMRMMMGTS